MLFKTKVGLSNEVFEGYLNISNIEDISNYEIKKIEKNIKNSDSWNSYKLKIFRSWINDNFKLDENFIKNFEKMTKKLRIQLSTKDERFIFNIKSLYFATWRPLKEILVKFQLDKKEVVYFYEADGNLYEFNDSKSKYDFIVNGDLFFSNKKFYICDKRQKVLKSYSFNTIKDVKIDSLGVVIFMDNKKFLIRSHVRFMAYIVFQRLIPKLNLNIDSVDNLYDYFYFWNKILKKIV